MDSSTCRGFGLRYPPAIISTFIAISNTYVFVVLRYFEPVLMLFIGASSLILWAVSSDTHAKTNVLGLLAWLACFQRSIILLRSGLPAGGFM